MNHAHIELTDKYAQAFLNVFESTLTDAQLEIAEKVAFFLKERSDFLFLLQVSRTDNIDALRSLIRQYQLPNPFFILIAFIIKSKRALLLSDILYRIVYHYNKRQSVSVFTIKSVILLEEDEKEKIISYLEKRIGNRVRATFIVDDSLIAGIVLQSDEYKWDYSIKNRLRTIQNLLKR